MQSLLPAGNKAAFWPNYNNAALHISCTDKAIPECTATKLRKMFYSLLKSINNHSINLKTNYFTLCLCALCVLVHFGV